MFGTTTATSTATNGGGLFQTTPDFSKPKLPSSLFSNPSLVKAPAATTAYPLPRSSRFSDLKIVAGDEKLTYDVHKVIVCARSPVIRRAIEGDFAEAREGCYKITAFPSEIVNIMIDFMYTGHLSSHVDMGIYEALRVDHEDFNSVKERTRRLFIYLELNSIADYFDIANLRESANQKIERLLQDHWREIQPMFGIFVERTYGKTSDRDLHSLIISYTVSRIQDLKNEFSDFVELDIPKDYFAAVLCKSLGFKA